VKMHDDQLDVPLETVRALADLGCGGLEWERGKA